MNIMLRKIMDIEYRIEYGKKQKYKLNRIDNLNQERIDPT